MKSMYVVTSVILVAAAVAIGTAVYIWKNPLTFVRISPSVDRAKGMAGRAWNNVRNRSTKIREDAEGFLHTERDPPVSPAA